MAKKKTEKKSVETKNLKELLYMTTNEITAHHIKEVMEETGSIKVELWEDMNILQLELENGNTIDFEPMTEKFTEDDDVAFVKEQNIKTIFYITVEEQDFEENRDIFRDLLHKQGGFICTDSHNFQPIYKEDKL